MASDAPCRVLTSATLFRSITSYQRGVPSGLFHFWSAHAKNMKIPVMDRHSTFAKRLDLVPEFIAQYGDAHLLNLLPLITKSFPQRCWSGVCRQAAEKNDADMLQWAIDRGYLHAADALLLIVSLESDNVKALEIIKSQQELLAAIAPGALTSHIYPKLKDVAVIQWLQTHVPQLKWTWRHIAKGAVLSGRLEVLRYAYCRDATIKWHPSLLASQSHPSPARCECLRFLLKNHAQNMVGGVPYMLTLPSVEVLNMVNEFKHLYGEVVDAAIQQAVENENIHALHRFESAGWIARDERVSVGHWKVTDATLYLLERGLAMATDITMGLAAEAGRWDIVHYLHEHCSIHCTTRTMDAAARQGRLDDIKFFHHASSGHTMDLAAEAGNWDIVHYLHEQTSVRCTTRAMDAAVRQGRLDQIKFFHHASSGHTMDLAAEAGNWDIVHYLHEQTSVRCTTRAMDAAARQGRLDQIKFLHEHRTEGCSSSAVWDALHRGHHAVIEYLSKHYRHAFKGNLSTLLLHDEFAIWEALRDEYPAETEKSISDALSCASRYYYLSTVHYILDKLGRRDLAYKAMCEAAQASEMAWVVAVWRAAGPQSCTMQVVRFTVRWCYGSSSRVKFVIDNCIEPNAREQAIQYVREENWTQLADELQRGWTSTPGDSIELHPWLLDARTPKWVVERLLKALGHYKDDWYNRVGAMTWPIEAAYRCDVTVLAMTLEASHSAATSGDTDPDPELSFEGARAAAVRIGDVPTVQWLLEHVDMPVESTLLDEALFYHRYEVALWLATYCPEACTALEPEPRPRPMDKDPGYSDSMRKWLDTWKYKDCGYDASLRQWLETDGAILRQFIDIDMIPWEKSGREEAK